MGVDEKESSLFRHAYVSSISRDTASILNAFPRPLTLLRAARHSPSPGTKSCCIVDHWLHQLTARHRRRVDRASNTRAISTPTLFTLRLAPCRLHALCAHPSCMACYFGRDNARGQRGRLFAYVIGTRAGADDPSQIHCCTSQYKSIQLCTLKCTSTCEPP